MRPQASSSPPAATRRMLSAHGQSTSCRPAGSRSGEKSRRSHGLKRPEGCQESVCGKGALHPVGEDGAEKAVKGKTDDHARGRGDERDARRNPTRHVLSQGTSRSSQRAFCRSIPEQFSGFLRSSGANLHSCWIQSPHCSEGERAVDRALSRPGWRWGQPGLVPSSASRMRVPSIRLLNTHLAEAKWKIGLTWRKRDQSAPLSAISLVLQVDSAMPPRECSRLKTLGDVPSEIGLDFCELLLR